MNNIAPIPPPAAPRPDTSIVKPPSVLLLGDVGGGKTFSISTLLEAGLEVFVLITEANGLDTLLDAVKKKGLDVEKLHWRYVPPSVADWAMMEKVAGLINTKDYDQLSKTTSGFGKETCLQYVQVIKSCGNFHDDRTGKDFSDVTSWGDNRAFVIDSMSGLNDIIRTAHLGHKPTPHMGEWGTIMNVQLNLLKTLTASCKCFFVVTAHVDREPDLIEGGTKLTVAALGSKNAPQINRLFSEIVYTRKSGAEGQEAAIWSTADPRLALKNRGLTFGNNLFPSFQSVVSAYRRRLQTAKTEAAAPPAPSAPRSDTPKGN